jgi:hypothetical protein
MKNSETQVTLRIQDTRRRQTKQETQVTLRIQDTRRRQTKQETKHNTKTQTDGQHGTH